MRVFSVKHDPCYQYFAPTTSQPGVLAELDGSFREEVWVPPVVVIPEPRLLRGDFFNADGGYWITSSRATEILRDLMSVAGQLFPITFQAHTYMLLNVTECYDCLDHDLTVWTAGSEKCAARIMRYAFHSDLLPRCPIFKIPEEATDSIFVSEGMVEDEFEFREILRREDLRGLTFTEVWSGGDDSEDD